MAATRFYRLVLACAAAFGAATRSSSCARVAVLQERILALLVEERWRLGEADAVVVLPLLHKSFRAAVHAQPSQWLIDIGANAGGTAALMMELFTTLPCARTSAARVTIPDEGCTHLQGVRVLAVEAVPPTFDMLHARARSGGWYDHGFLAAVAAISDSDAPNVSIHSVPGQVGDEQASLTAGVATAAFTADAEPIPMPTQVHYVQQARMDTLAAQNIPSDASIFMLKSDVEGLDPAVLLGAQGLLDAHRVQWLLFEYGKKWSITNGTSPMYTLKGAVAWLRARGYYCHVVTPTHLIPLFDAWWFSPKLEFREWSNVLCGSDWDDTSALVRFYNAGGIEGLHLHPHWGAGGC